MAIIAGPYPLPAGFKLPDGIVQLPPIYLKQPSKAFETHVSIGAWEFATRLVDWLPGSTVLLAGDESIAVTVRGKLVGIIRHINGQWVWQE